MHDTTTSATSASQREGTAMTNTRNHKRVVAASVMIAALAGGVVSADAATFSDRTATTATVDPPMTWPAITPTMCTPTDNGDCGITLFAGPGNVIVGDTTATAGKATVPFLGFGINITDPAQVSLAGGPTSTIKVTEGTTLKISVSGATGVDVSDISFPSLPAGSVYHDVADPDGVLTVVASKVGTSVFQPGSNPTAPREVAMGLVGVLVVTPAACATPNATCAFDGATSYADEAIVATTDLDYDFATSADQAHFDMSYFGQVRDANDLPRHVYHVINGQSFPATDLIDVRAGDNVLLRYVNAGVSDKAMGMLGLRQSLLGRNAAPYTDPQTLIAPLIGPGETADIAVTIPADATPGPRYSIVDQSRQMNHGNAFGFGGALTFIDVWPATPVTPDAPLAPPPAPVVLASPTVDTLAYDSTTSPGTFTATAHVDSSVTVAGYETTITETATPPDATAIWTAGTFDPTGAISEPLVATAGQTIWIHVKDSSGAQSADVSLAI